MPQWSFEGSPKDLILYRDTISNPNCRWQIGKPNKTIFTEAETLPNAIVTDTINTIPVNDTSVFYISAQYDAQHGIGGLLFSYKLDGDSADFGKIEISPDSGQHWVNIIAQESTYHIIWTFDYTEVGFQPTLNGVEHGWYYFACNFGLWAYSTSGYPVLWDHNIPTGSTKTALFRFTYITDSINNPRDGWMIDDVRIWGGITSVSDLSNNVQMELSPNPVEDVLHIKRKIGGAKDESVQVMNMMGEVVFSGQWSVVGGELSVDVSGLAKGVYLLRYSCDKGEARERFVKE